MAALRSNCTVVEQRALIRFLWPEGVKTFEAGDSQQRFAVQGGFFCSTMTCVRIPRQLPLKQSGS
jgi:hypothetical protein